MHVPRWVKHLPRKNSFLNWISSISHFKRLLPIIQIFFNGDDNASNKYNNGVSWRHT